MQTRRSKKGNAIKETHRELLQETRFELLEELQEALLHHESDKVKNIALQDPTLLNEKIFFEDRPIHQLVRLSSPDPNPGIQLLLELLPQAAKETTGYHDVPQDEAEEQYNLGRMEEYMHSEEYGLLPLHLAASNSTITVDTLRALIKAYPEALLVQDDGGNCPLHYALIFNIPGPFENFKFLLESCPQAATKRDKLGVLPLDHAIKKGHKKETQLLRKYD